MEKPFRLFLKTAKYKKMKIFLIFIGKAISLISKLLNLGHGSTWPGHIALSINKNFIREIIKANPQLKIILIAGTNGKTTTGKLIQTILERSGKKVFQNESGANLLNGICSTLIHQCNEVGSIYKDFGIFEIDENTLPIILGEINNPAFIIILNLFRDQLDRYGEVNTISEKWAESLKKLSKKTTLILNADDPQIAFLGKSRGVLSSTPSRWNHIDTSVFYFGLDDKTLHQTSHQHAVDSTYCPHCGSKLYYKIVYYSHLGDWECKNCDYKRPIYIFSTPPPSPLTGIYNKYNILAAVLVAKIIGVTSKLINDSVKTFTPAFGRQEILKVDGKKVQIFLSKNPTSFNESLRTIADLNAKNVLFVLNDRIPDGLDVSWIWDVDTEEYIKNFNSIIISGDRVLDMGLRIKYSYSSEFPISSRQSRDKFQIVEDLRKAVALSLEKTPKSEALYILPTYSAMLEVRKILTGRKIL